jgi:dual 3',5'-cyclic-AMP and -GMP phosphodiesterase 11
VCECVCVCVCVCVRARARLFATDMSIHFDKIKELEKRDPASFDSSKEHDRLQLVSLLVHSADLSAQTLPTHIATVWEQRISLEFEEQAKAEAARGLPVAPFMQNLENAQHRAKLQVNFIGFVLEPWWKNVTRLFPGLRDCWTNLSANKRHFEVRGCRYPWNSAERE